MRIYRQTLLVVSVLSLLSLVINAQASQRAAFGTISFQGAIVNDTCNLNPLGQNVQIDCPADKTSARIVTAADRRNIGQSVPQVAKVEMNWKDASQRVGVMTITYK